jgi:membrane-bound ClpP family serine protease
MWIVAGILLGLVVATSLIGFHSGPHTHVVAGVVGILAAAWLALMAAEGRSAALLWVLFGADLVISVGIGVMGWTAIRRSGRLPGRTSSRQLEGAEGVAVTDLSPDGIVRVGGEQWSATCVNGPLAAGTRVQVLRGGVRLEVWGERPGVPAPGRRTLTAAIAEALENEKEKGT